MFRTFRAIENRKLFHFRRMQKYRKNHVLFFLLNTIALIMIFYKIGVLRTYKSSFSRLELPREEYNGVLISYAYKDGSKTQRENLKYFLKHGLSNRKDVSFVFTLNDAPNCKYKSIIPRRKNIEVKCRRNIGFDTCAHGNVLREEKFKRKKYVVFMNGSARGPFSPGDCLFVNRTMPFLYKHCSELKLSFIKRQRRLDKSERFWVDRFTTMMEKSNTNGKIAGPYISCDKSPHVQSWLIVAHRDVLHYARETLTCFDSRKDAILYGELALSKVILSNGYNLLSPIKEYMNMDFRKGIPQHICGHQNPGKALGFCPYGNCRSLNPLETIFFKNSGGLIRDHVLDRSLQTEVDYLSYLKSI